MLRQSYRVRKINTEQKQKQKFFVRSDHITGKINPQQIILKNISLCPSTTQSQSESIKRKSFHDFINSSQFYNTLSPSNKQKKNYKSLLISYDHKIQPIHLVQKNSIELIRKTRQKQAQNRPVINKIKTFHKPRLFKLQWKQRQTLKRASQNRSNFSSYCIKSLNKPTLKVNISIQNKQTVASANCESFRPWTRRMSKEHSEQSSVKCLVENL